MSYQILARKYRPQQFDDIIAQEHVTKTLKNALSGGRLSSGYLFTGPRGTGKTSTARILAKALNCVEGPTATPCDKCPSCLEIVSASSLDVLEIDAASNTGVDDIRTLRENVRYLPTSGKKRIYIIDEVHRLSGSAFDALLKTLEEPPPHVVFIFATTEPHKVPETIRSRTQRYDFRRVSVPDLIKHLKKVAEAEKIGIDDEALFIIARKADGAVRDSLSLLDQLSSFSEGKITERQVVEALGLVERQVYFRYVDIIAARESAKALEIIKELINSGVEIPEFCMGVIEHFRDLLILKNSDQPERILEVSDSEFENFRRQIDYFSTGDLLRMIKLVSDTIFDMRSGLSPRLLLETATLRLANLESTIVFEDILAYLSDQPDLQASESSTDLFGAPAKHAPTGISFRQPESGPEATTEKSQTLAELPSFSARPVNLPIVQSNWDKFLEHLRTQNAMLPSLLGTAEIKEVKDNIVTAVFYNAGGSASRQVVEQPNFMTIITASLRDFFKTNLKIKFEIDLSKKTIAPVRSQPPTEEKIDAEKLLAGDEKLRNLVEKLDGEIIGKRKVEE